MDKFIFYCSLLVVISSQCVWYKGHHILKHRDDNDVKIVGGNETTIETYPHQAYLLVYDGRDYYQCGGSIVNTNFIVTAAHCLSGMQIIYVRIGSTNASSGGTQYQTTLFYSHPRYNTLTSDYDVGLVRIQEGMNLDGTNARAIAVVNAGYDPKEGEEVILTGWGVTAQNGSTSYTLMVVQVPVVSRMRCNELFRNSITIRMFCAGLNEGGKDTCQGDSGGPAVNSSSNELIGITSFGYGCAQPNSPGVYTLISNPAVRSFIKIYTGV